MARSLEKPRWRGGRAGWLWLLVLSALEGTGQAAPLLETRVGGLALSGPAVAHAASVFYNPATLSLLPGHHAYLDGTLRLGTGSVTLRATETQTGRPRLDESLPGQDLLEVFPQLFLTGSSNLGLESVVLGLTLHTPFAQRFSYLSGSEAGELFDPSLQWAGRYHAVDFMLYSLFLTTSGAFRIFDKLSIGVSISYVFLATSFGFVRDAALEGGLARDPGEPVALDDCGGGNFCGYGSAAAAEAIRIKGQANAIAFSAGLLIRPHPRIDVGVAYHSRVVGSGASNVPARGDAWVRRSQASLDNARQDPALGAGLSRDLEGRGTLTYALPDLVNLGVAAQISERLLLDLQFRWVNFSAHDVLDVRLTGTEFRARPEIPDRLVHRRGFQDIFLVQLGASFQLTPALLLSGASLLETAAVPASASSPAAVDNLKVDSFVAARWSLGRGFSLHGGYGLVLMPSREVQSSIFSPGDVVACVEARYDVDLPECRRSAAGQGLASAAGRYQLAVHRFSLGLGYDLW